MSEVVHSSSDTWRRRGFRCGAWAGTVLALVFGIGHWVAVSRGISWIGDWLVGLAGLPTSWLAMYWSLFFDAVELPFPPPAIAFLLFAAAPLVINWALWGWVVGAVLDGLGCRPPRPRSLRPADR